ncbi:MAG: hypothetical protein NZ556_05295 [Fimbriimonadales bacterium]|nr:hypothetical protein [Fimbriimonadales bacterium]
MTDSKYATLRRKLQQEKNLAKIMTYFFDHFADHQEFIRSSEKGRNEFIETVLPIVVRSVLGTRVTALVNLMQLYVPQQKMWHGSFLVGNSVGAFFYFEDLDMGLVGVSGGRLGSQLISARFQAKMFDLPKDE